MKKKPHGGARKGAGRKPQEPTVVMRIPVSLVEAVKKLLLKGKRPRRSRKSYRNIDRKRNE